ncbi:cyclin-dependent protein kinase inhibitor SMR [Salix suchowensis]|nr:cyclin-dependent protein kinase inhibitor SMR [Salix suchowensis]
MSSDQELLQNLPELGLKVKIKADDHGGGHDQCCTPTSAPHQIPPFLTCPPAPKKPRRRIPAGSWKRRLSNLHFFEVMNREEVDLFFRSSKKAGFVSGVVA